jgi:hypothetical protein
MVLSYFFNNSAILAMAMNGLKIITNDTNKTPFSFVNYLMAAKLMAAGGRAEKICQLLFGNY